MSFLESLGNQLLSSLNQQANIGENTNRSLEVSKLNSKIDQTEERVYLGDGVITSNLMPRSLQYWMQEPDLTVVIKKRHFSSLAENYRFDLLSSDEQAYIRAVKRLFHNKCKLIAAYERLTKIENITSRSGVVNDRLLPLIYTSVELFNAIAPGIISPDTLSALDILRKLQNFSEPNFETTWLLDSGIPYLLDTGEGNGVFELTLVSNMSCTNSINLGGGNGSLSIEDPYKLMIITSNDIEQAIAETTNFTSNAFFKITQDQLQQAIEDLKKSLSQLRINRDVGQIRFLINGNTLLFKKVRAIFEEEGREINFIYRAGVLGIGASVELDPSATQGPQGLLESNGEVTLFKQIIENYYLLLELEQSTQTQQIEYNKSTNYLRRNMQLEFQGKAIIQPQDVVRIFVSSKSIKDARVSVGLTSDFFKDSLLGNLDSTIGQIESTLEDISALFDNSNNSAVEVEKNIIVGPEFPTWLWLMLRNQFTRQTAGTCVFAGLVRDVSSSYDNGRYSLSVTLEDQSAYFKKGQININPGLDVYNGDLYDPLTPFNLEFDASSGFIKGEFPELLPENQRLLDSGIVKAHNGRFRGQIISKNNYLISDAEKAAGNLFRNKLNDPLGFTYRWKRGIGSLTLFGEPNTNSFFNTSDRSPAINADPFAGQDVMNVISLLVTGQPYNFNTFMRASLQFGNLNQNGGPSFFRGLISDLLRNNKIWGGFIPFKKMIINDQAYSFLRKGEFDLTTSNQRLNDLARQRAEKFDQLTSLVPQLANNPQFYKAGLGGEIIVDSSLSTLDLTSLSKLGEDIIRLDSQIQGLQNDFTNHLQNPNIQQTNGTLLIFGDDISFDPNVTFGNNAEEVKEVKRELRKKINQLTQRRLWKVKSNEDPNLFIVDDSYDKNYDIQAFEKTLSGNFQTFKSTYTNIFEKLQAVSQILGLEVFADSQGHIQARPPQYNRMPSSVFYQMLTNKERKGIQIFPKYLENLFLNQIRGLTDQLEIVEDEIRFRAAILGSTNDIAATSLLNGSSLSGAYGSRAFVFTTSETDGRLGSKDIRLLLTQADVDLLESVQQETLEQLATQIRGATTATVNFDILQRVQVINSSQTFVGVTSDVASTLDRISQRLREKKGGQPITLQSVLGNSSATVGYNRTQLEILNVTQQLSSFIAERQQLVKLLSNALSNLQQSVQLNQNPESFTNLIFPFLSKNSSKKFPEILEHMIEDETFDDYGSGSGQRYILSDDKIINYSVSEVPPNWTAVEVSGALENALVDLPSSLGGISEHGGNGISTAFAVDYDLWRMYGFSSTQSVYLPFLSDPESQCAPYAVYLLNRARKEIFQASVTCIGNEFLQPGEVYYLEDREMLFYSESVSHSFSYGGSFTSTLNLKFGHPPGEYIPTMLDIIGKSLYATRHQANLIRHNRFESSNDETHLATIVKDGRVGNIGASGIDQLTSGSFESQNRRNLSHLVLAASGLIGENSSSSNLNVEIRFYSHLQTGFAENSDLRLMAESIASWLANPQKSAIFPTGFTSTPDTSVESTIDASKIQVSSIDLSDPNNSLKNPSSSAWNAARTLSLTSSVSGLGLDVEIAPEQLAQLEKQILFSQIIDIWAVNKTQETTFGQPSDTSSQAQMEELDKYNNNFKRSLGLE